MSARNTLLKTASRSLKSSHGIDPGFMWRGARKRLQWIKVARICDAEFPQHGREAASLNESSHVKVRLPARRAAITISIATSRLRHQLYRPYRWFEQFAHSIAQKGHSMKIFLSWSGDTSHKVACALRDWLPSVIQSVKPYVSSEDIDKGARWSSDIAQELEKSTYGIICVTKGNIDAPWVNFEAGALSKALDKSFVSPFLFNMNRADVQGPLLQFQSTVYESDDVEKLVGSVNSRLELHERLDDSKLKKAFDVWWPMLKEELDKIHEPTTLGDTEMVKDKHQLILEEIVELSRSQYKLLRDPESLLPQSYLNFVFESGRNRVSEASLDRLHRAVIRIQKQVEVEDEEDTTSKSIRDEIEVLHSLIHDLMRPPRLPRRTVPYVDEVKG